LAECVASRKKVEKGNADEGGESAYDRCAADKSEAVEWVWRKLFREECRWGFTDHGRDSMLVAMARRAERGRGAWVTGRPITR
jgi:hypothetical protein